MKFDKLYPFGTCEDSYTEYNVFKSTTEWACTECRELTYWVDVVFECHICSEGCSDTQWQKYVEASRGEDDEDEEMFIL